MAICLTDWLEETFATQLLLGNDWLRLKNERKEHSVKSETERSWRGLYHDNGSCLDITNDIHPERNSYLRIVQLSPFVLTDAQTQVHSHLAPECLTHFPPQISLHAVIAVRKYTIRYTSYGPPRDKLRFILHAVEWLGAVPRGLHEPCREELKPLWTEEILDILRQLDHTRAREDRRCLTSSLGMEEEADEIPMIMDGADEGESQPHTQDVFSTQAAHPVRARPSQDEPRVLGAKQLEPVLAGNTQREEIRSRAANAGIDKRAQLLNLLQRKDNFSTDKPTKALTEGIHNTSLSRPPGTTEPFGTQLLTQRPTVTHRQPAQTQTKDKDVTPTLPEPARSTKPVREAEIVSPGTRNNTTDSADIAPATAESEGGGLQRLASECSWMKGLEFSRESLRVPHEQMCILLKNDSWHKPQVGSRFPDGNVPIGILTELYSVVDENAAMEARPDFDDKMDENPSPEDPSPGSPHQQSQDDQTLSQVSWAPSPEPPKPPELPEPHNMPPCPDQGLPPDSSFEIPEASDDLNTRVTISQRPVIINLSNEKEQSVPPSSSPVEEQYDEVYGPMVYDDETEMEEFVPQGLGEDNVERGSEVQNQLPMSVSPPPKSFVQVKETPYVKGKSGQSSRSATSPQPHKYSLSSTLKNTSSTSIVYGTYKDDTLSGSTNEERHPEVSEAAMGDREEHGTERPEHEQLRDNCRQGLVEGAVEVPVNDTGCLIAPITLPEPESVRMEAQTAENSTVENNMPRSSSQPIAVTAPRPKTSPCTLDVPASPSLEQPLGGQGLPKEVFASKSPSIPPGTTKRKLEISPSKRSSRHAKRRELKIVSFGDASLPSADPTSELRQHGEESLRKFREERKSSTSFESHAEPAVTPDPPPDGDRMDVDSSSAQTSNESVSSMSPRHISLYEAPSPAKEVQTTVRASQPTSGPSQIAQAQAALETPDRTAHAQSGDSSQIRRSSARSLSVFEMFRATYPEYTGDVKHFQGQCMQMIKLDEEDKMVPKWQWDDYIIRNRTDFRVYALECVDRGDNPEPYHRFYKDTIRDTVYRKNIIEGRATLLKALEQLGVQPPVSDDVESPVSGLPDQLKSISSKEKRSRASLLSAFNQTKASVKHHVNSTYQDRPRHSLPASSQITRQTPLKSLHTTKIRIPAPPGPKDAARNSRSTPKPSLLSRLSLDGAVSPVTSVNSDTTEGASDPFRDFYFAYQRATSLTGSTKVDSRLSWPRNLAVRPSIADVPKKKINVLKWNDDL